jgi:hypothetical protein
MTALGVRDDKPANPSQPPLADGMHLRWGFDRDLGFPSYGFYLFRRPARPGNPLCVSAVSGGLTKGDWPGNKYHTAVGVLSSSDNLVLTEEFAPNAQVEFALGGRKYLRFDLPAGETARRFELRVGFRPACIAAESLIAPETVKAPGAVVSRPSPLTLQGVTFRVSSPTGAVLFDLVNTNAGQLVGLGCGNGLTLTLATPSNNVELLFTRVINSPGTVDYFDAKGKPLGTVQLASPVGQTETVRLSGQNIARVEVRTIRNILFLHRLCAEGLAVESTVKVTAYAGTTRVRSITVSGRPGQVVSAAVEEEALTALEIGPGPAALVDLCYVPVAQDATQGWETIRGVPYPLGLPVTQPDYPCSVPAPQSLVSQRVRYPMPPGWVLPGTQLPTGAQDSFTQLHAQLVELVRGGVAAAPMADRIFNAPPAVSNPPDPDPPKLSTFYILDMLLMGALHPALAQLLGLYWVDQTAALDAAYDYLIVADYTGVGQLDAGKVLKAIQTSGFDKLDGYVVYNKRVGPVPPLPPPTGLKTFELPGGTFANADGQLPQSSNNAGLVWDVGWDDAGGLAPDGSVMYLVWRAYLGDAAVPSSVGTHALVTKVPPDKPKPVVVTEARLPNGYTPQRSPDWPTFPLNFIDRNLADGWYSFQVSGIDLFGRYSANGTPATVRLRDTIAPPAVGIEATALDPEDPFVQQDKAYQEWRQSLDPSVRDTLVGLRARWVWPAEYQRQAPDTAEFRLYFHPGAALPNAPDNAVNWQERYHVVKYSDSDIVTVNTSNGERTYELFLPPAGTKSLADAFPLNPTLTQPVVYAHVAVTAADAKPHTADLRVTGKWSKRPGNESPVGAPARVYRVWRKPPPAPEPAMNSGRYYASPADYHSRSFFTYRWKPQPALKLHVFRALDDAVFKADWAQRQLKLKLDPSKPELFPPGWNLGLRQKVALELNALRALVKLEEDAGKALALYRKLSDAALRVLAGSANVESAFVQLTINPLGPDNADARRVGADYPDGATLDAGEQTFIDTLDGRTDNCYFYRAAFVDAGHNLGPLGSSSPPVYLPKVTPPVSPVLTRVSGGERRIELRWVKGGEPDLSAYRVYRAADAARARDIRLMERVQELPIANLNVNDNELSWADETVPPGRDFYYRLTALDSEPAPNESAPSKVLVGRAVDTVPPQAPEWLSAEWVLYDPATSSTQPWPGPEAVVPTPYRAAVRLALKTSADLCTVYRRAEGEKTWHAVNATPAPAHGQLLAFDLDATPGQKFYYRAAAANQLGVTSPYSAMIVVEAE